MSAVIGQLSQLSFVLKLSQTLFLPCGTEDKRQLTFLYVCIYIERSKWLQKHSKWRSATKPDQPKVLAKMQKGLYEGQEYGKEKEDTISYH